MALRAPAAYQRALVSARGDLEPPHDTPGLVFPSAVRDTQHRTAAGLMPSSAERPAGAADL